MKQYGVTYLDYYLPSEKQSVAEVIGNIDLEMIPPVFSDREEYIEFAGNILELKSVWVESVKSDVEMLDVLLQKMFDTGVVRPEDIDLIITTQEPQQRSMDNAVKYLQYTHKMVQAKVLNISGNHCANIPAAWDFLESGSASANNVLIVSGFKCKSANERVLGAYGILSDGAGVMLLGKSGGKCSLIGAANLSNGSMFKVDMHKDSSLIHYKYMLSSLKKLLASNPLAPESVKVIIPQNANILLLSNVIMDAGLDTRKIFTDNLSRVGHIDSVDFIINLKSVLEEKKPGNGDLILVLNMGWAGSYLTSLLSVN